MVLHKASGVVVQISQRGVVVHRAKVCVVAQISQRGVVVHRAKVV